MVQLHIVLLLSSCIISSLCNGMERSGQQLHLGLESKNFNQREYICGVDFPVEDMIVKISCDAWSTFCAKDGTHMIDALCAFPKDFCLSKNGKLAISEDRSVTIYDIHSGKLLFLKELNHGAHKIAFSNDNKRIIMIDRCSVSSHSSEQIHKEIKETILPFVKFCNSTRLLISNPTSNKFFITNTGSSNNVWKASCHEQVKINIDEQDNITAEKWIKNHDIITSGEFSPNGRVLALHEQFKGYQFYDAKNDHCFLTINSEKNSDKESPYHAIAFHPKKLCAALLNKNENSVEFWDYTKKTDNPLAIIKLHATKGIETFFWLDYPKKLLAFSPSGNRFVAVSNYDNICSIIATPDAAYYDEATKEQSIFLNWAMKNDSSLFILQDIIQLILKNISKLSNLDLFLSEKKA